MQDKRFYPYLFLHAGIVTLWVILDRTHKGIANDGAINLLSIAVLLCYFNLLYLHVMTSRRKATISECGWNLLSVSFIAALMYDGFSTLYTGAFLVFALIIGIMLVRTDASRGKMVRLLFGIASIILSFFNFRILPAITMLVGMFMGIFLDYRYINLKQVNILPIAQRKARYVLALMIPLFTVVLYCFDLSTLQVNVFFQLIMLLFEAFAVIHLGDMEARYNELTKYYELTNYIASEREDFSMLLHNDVLQDIGGAKNLLSLRSPAIDETKRILSDLELRIRNMMNFYSSNIFSGYASWEHIEYMLDAIKKLYPKKNIFIDFTIDSEARIALKKDNSLEQTMQIIKELVNNVYKHAAASFIHLEIALNEESKLVITCQNDGAKSNDIENILSSKGGMLFLTVLINGNGGNIQYLEKDGILTATAVLGRKMKILLFDDHRIFGESLSKLLEDWDEISICRYVSNETEFWNILSVDEWDIVLLDVNLREQSKSSGIDLIETIYSKKPKIKVVMLSSYDMPVYRQEALKKGAVSYIDKSASADELVKKLTAISKGHKSTTPPLLDPLTDREAEIIKAIGTGKTKHEIAQELYISERTLYNHIQSIYDKLGAKNAIEAYNKAIALGYITPLI